MNGDEIKIDEISNVVTCPVSLKWADLETHLNESGYTLGYCNPKKKNARLRDLMGRLAPNLFYRQYGQPIQWCISARFVGKKGETYTTKPVPRTATGPDFRRILLRSGHRYGELEEVTVRFRLRPEAVDWHWSYWPTAAAAKQFINEIEASDYLLSFAGVYGVERQPLALRHGGKVLVTLRFAGLEGLVRAGLERSGATMRRLNGEAVRIAHSKVIPFLEKLIGETST